VPPQNPVDLTIVDISALGVKLAWPDASLAVRPARDRQIEPEAAARTNSLCRPPPRDNSWPLCSERHLTAQHIPQLRDGTVPRLPETLRCPDCDRKNPTEAGLPDGGDPSDAKLEPSCGISHRLGGAPLPPRWKATRRTQGALRSRRMIAPFMPSFPCGRPPRHPSGGSSNAPRTDEKAEALLTRSRGRSGSEPLRPQRPSLG